MEALVNASAGNLQDLHSPETLEALEGYTVLRTDRDGWIEPSTDGKQMWVEAARKCRVEKKNCVNLCFVSIPGKLRFG